MQLTWEKVNMWAFSTNRVSEIAQAAFEWELPGKGKTSAEIRQLVLEYVTKQTAANGLQAEADLPDTLKETITAYFTAPVRPPTPQRTVDGPKTPAAPAATGHTAGTPQGDARPVHQNAVQRFLNPLPRTPEDEGLSRMRRFLKYR